MSDAQLWIFSVRFIAGLQGRKLDTRFAAVGPANIRTVEAAIRQCPADIADAVRVNATVREFIEGKLDPRRSGYYEHVWDPSGERPSYVVCIGPVDEVVT